MFVKPLPIAVYTEIGIPAELFQTSFNTAREKHLCTNKSAVRQIWSQQNCCCFIKILAYHLRFTDWRILKCKVNKVYINKF